jgi:hypothetical protein
MVADGALSMKNGVLLDITSCGSRNNRYFGGTYRLHRQGEKNQGARKEGSN